MKFDTTGRGLKAAAVAAQIGALFAACVTVAGAAPSMRDVLVASYKLRDLSGVALSSDGARIAWQEGYHDPARLLQSLTYDSIYVASVNGGDRTRVSAGTRDGLYDEEEPVFSPDGRRLAFFSDARSRGQLQLYAADADGNNVRQITTIAGNAARLTWSPDGKLLAFLYIAAAHRKAGAIAPGARDVGVIGSETDEQRIATVDSAGGTPRFVTPSDTYVYEYGWSPDSRQLAATYAKGNGDNNWWVARLATVDASTGAMRDLLAPSYQINDPQWSPDGNRIALIGGIMSDFGSTGGDVYLVDARSGETRDVTDGAPVSVQSLRWNDASSLDVVAHVAGAMRLMRLDLAAPGTSALTSLTQRDESLWSWSSAQNGNVVALVRASFADPARSLGRRAVGIAAGDVEQRRPNAAVRQSRVAALERRRRSGAGMADLSRSSTIPAAAIPW